MIVLLAAAFALMPVHGVVLDTLPDRSVIVRTDPVPAMRAARTSRFRFRPSVAFGNGTSVDALLDGSTQPPTLRDAIAAARFAPGLPDSGKAVRIEPGSPLPAAEMVDQDGRAVQLDRAFRGKTLLLSFVFTRCPDRTLCPAISGKFAYLQEHLDPQHFSLAEITLDPQYDSPEILRRYAAHYGARRASWKLLTATGSTIERLLDAFAVSSMRVSTANFLHDDKLVIVSPSGQVATIVATASWDPDGALAQARAVAGLAANPFERMKLALIADAIALCGGSQFAGIALLELSLFTIITVVALLGMWAVARVLWPRRRKTESS
jgi:cytochrome oxidase Cu insertion factor (SCO1/SenC/PrrC family)